MLSRTTDARRAVMPLDGTLDFWMLAVTTAMSAAPNGVALNRQAGEDEALRLANLDKRQSPLVELKRCSGSLLCLRINF